MGKRAEENAVQDQRRDENIETWAKEAVRGPDWKRELYVLLVHFVILGLLALGALTWNVPLYHLGLGFLAGVALYSLFWRYWYGFWPD